jgi:outer membrane receptor for ferrienterochelin and colicins
MLDASVKTSFLDKKLDLTFGARNLLNMKNINSTAGGNVGGAHSGGSGNMLLAYGTSFFAKLTYNINFN